MLITFRRQAPWSSPRMSHGGRTARSLGGKKSWQRIKKGNTHQGAKLPAPTPKMSTKTFKHHTAVSVVPQDDRAASHTVLSYCTKFTLSGPLKGNIGSL